VDRSRDLGASGKLYQSKADRAELLARVAELYYLDGRDQRSIASEMSTSRSNVSRLLTEARQRGIVEIRIHKALGRAHTIEDELVDAFDLLEARVLASRPDVGPDDALQRVGELAAAFLMEHITDGLTIGLSWGTSLAAMVDATRPGRSYEVEIVQILGGLSSVSVSLSGHELGRSLADRLGGTFNYLHAPAIVDSVELRNSLLRQPGIASVLKRAERADLAFVGIGSLGEGSSRALFSEAGLSKSEQRQLKSSGAVGDICARLFSIDGVPCEVSVNHRVIGVHLKDLPKIASVVGVAKGFEKAPGILGAVRGRFVNVLVTDESTAAEVIRLNEKTGT